MNDHQPAGFQGTASRSVVRMLTLVLAIIISIAARDCPAQQGKAETTARCSPSSTDYSMNPTARLAATIAQDKTGENTLQRAVWSQDRELTKRLLEQGANAKETGPGDGLPLIAAAASQGDPVIVALLLNHGADVNANPEGGTPLFWAARQGNLEAVRTLIACGANVHSRNRDGMTALHATLGDRNDVRIAKALLDAGADIEARQRDMTPLMTAALFDRAEWVKLFLERGANPGATTSAGQSALDFSRAGGSSAIEQMLVGRLAKKK